MNVSAIDIMISKMIKESIVIHLIPLIPKFKENDQTYLKMISSDGHRLTIMIREVDAAIDNLQLKPLTLIPRRGVQEIRKFCENRNSFLFGVEEKQAVLKSSESLLVIRLMEGDFPDFQGLLDSLTRENHIHIDRNRCLESLKRINLFTEDMFHAIKMEVYGTTMVLTSHNAAFGSTWDEFEGE